MTSLTAWNPTCSELAEPQMSQFKFAAVSSVLFPHTTGQVSKSKELSEWVFPHCCRFQPLFFTCPLRADVTDAEVTMP